ncbi:hypothetical protein RGQ29_006057 [Quercus rubra]|uniref:Probable ubiquitin-like-specific protease 2A/B PH domain-containing protein n=1 Tax=Quercus rubra TaxID=3512 RepID=A0AAN7E5V1_QUERU|nr:hypothetical protein RGQ29_006057 [Quercus rubra]
MHQLTLMLKVVLETKSPQKEFDVASQRFKILRKKVGTELLDIDASDTDHQCPMEFSVEDGTVRVETPGLDTLLLSSSSNSENKEVGTASDYDDNIGTCSSTSDSSPAIDFSSKLRTVSPEEHVSECGSGGDEIDIVNMTVHVFPDFLIYGDIYCTKCQLTFSNSSIKLEGSTVNGLKEIFSFEWAVGANTKIESEWFGRVETAVVNLHLKSRGSKGAGNAKETSVLIQKVKNILSWGRITCSFQRIIFLILMSSSKMFSIQKGILMLFVSVRETLSFSSQRGSLMILSLTFILNI